MRALLPTGLLVAALLVPPPAGSTTWSETLERVAPAVVSVQADLTRPFEGQRPAATQGTGFVVDASRGLILTNRHLVTAGPVVARAIFINGESVELEALYRDPIHDFGFFRFDPDQLRFLSPPTLDLVPDAISVGTEIRVVGNDAGETLSILAGTISRLDRQAPTYNRLGYNDFNTFYVQAATGSSGGSSGSPVIDQQGRVLALASGARTDAQTSFFLPLDRVVHALDKLRHDAPIARGSILVTFAPRLFFELRELGLPPKLEREVRDRHPEANGLLSVARILPDSPAQELLELGDILISADGRPVVDFVTLEALLDGAVGSTLELSLLRGGQELQVEVPVADLHAITPSAFLDFGGTTLHAASYQLARRLNLPLDGFQVSLPGFLLADSAVEAGGIITEFEGRRFENTRALADWLAGIPDGRDLRIRYRHPEQPGQVRFAVVRAQRNWFPDRYCERPVVGGWTCRTLGVPDPVKQDIPEQSGAVWPRTAEPAERDAAVVHVEFQAPFGMLGYNELRTATTGLVVDPELGWIAVDRDRVPHPMGEVRVVFGGLFELPARVLYVHPTHGLTIVKYDPAKLPIRPPVPRWSGASPGEKVFLLSSDQNQQLSRREGEVIGRNAPRPASLKHLKFRDMNLEALMLSGSLDVGHGVLVDGRGRVVGMLTETVELGDHRAALPSGLLTELLDSLASKQPIYSMEAELEPIPISEARRLGLPAGSHELEASPGSRVLRVERTVTGTTAADLLRAGDLLLAVDGRPVGSFAELRRLLRGPTADLTVVRGGKLTRITMPLTALERSGIDRIIHWSGALLHAPHRAVRLAGSRAAGVYIASYFFGSPAQRYELSPLYLIVSVDGTPVATLDQFSRAVEGLGDRETVRLMLEAWNGERRIVTLRTDLMNWPGFEVRVCHPGGPVERVPLGAGSGC